MQIRIRQQQKHLIPFVLFVSLFLIYLISSSGKTPYDYFTRLSNAFLQGKYYLSENPSFLNELIPGPDNKFFVVYPPMPAILLMPFVLIFGKNFPQQILAHVLGAGLAVIVYKIALIHTKSIKAAIWAFLLTGLGSIIWFLSSVGSAWYLGQISAAFFLTAAIYESLNKKRPLLVGVLLGAAYLSRIHTIISLPFFIYLLKSKNLKNIFKLGLGIFPFFLFNSIYNLVRFNVIWDAGYAKIPGLFQEPWYQKGLLHPSYIVNHLRIMFLSLPIIKNKFPFIQPSWGGLAIWITTPAFIYCLKASLKKRVVQITWAVILLISLVIFNHGTTGFIQFGYRFAVDFYPFLIFLTITSLINRKLRWHHWLLLIIGIIVNLWGVLWINKFGWVSY